MQEIFYKEKLRFIFTNLYVVYFMYSKMFWTTKNVQTEMRTATRSTWEPANERNSNGTHQPHEQQSCLER